MAESDAAPQKPKIRLPRSRLLLPLLIGATVSLVIGLFVLGFMSLTEPAPPAEELHSLMAQKQQAQEQAAPDNATEDSANMVVNEDGTFDFAQYRYFSFPLPFVINFADGKGMVTVEIALATYETTLRSERLMEKITTFTPKLRSAINLLIAEKTYEDVNSVAKRHALERQLLQAIMPIIDGANAAEPSRITALHFTKFVVTGIR